MTTSTPPRSRFAPLALAASLFLAASGLAGCGPGGGAGQIFLIVFSLSDTPEPLRLFTFRVAYAAKGEFVGNGTDVECEILEDAEDVEGDFDDDDDGTLTVEIDATAEPLDSVVEFLQCRFEASEQPTTQQFTVTVLSAEDEDEDPVATGDVDILVSSIDLEDSALRATSDLQ